MAFLAPLLIGPVSNLLDTVLKRILPAEKMSEAERTALTQQLQLELIKQDWSALEKEYQDRADARALAKADVEKGNWFSNLLAATVRPVWGIGVFVLYAYLIISPAIGLPKIDLDENMFTVMRSVLFFYFGGRTVEKVVDIMKNGKAKNGNEH